MRLSHPRKQTASEEVRRNVQEWVEVQDESLVARDEDRMIQAHASSLQRSDGTNSSHNVASGQIPPVPASSNAIHAPKKQYACSNTYSYPVQMQKWRATLQKSILRSKVGWHHPCWKWSGGKYAGKSEQRCKRNRNWIRNVNNYLQMLRKGLQNCLLCYKSIKFSLQYSFHNSRKNLKCVQFRFASWMRISKSWIKNWLHCIKHWKWSSL